MLSIIIKFFTCWLEDRLFISGGDVFEGEVILCMVTVDSPWWQWYLNGSRLSFLCQCRNIILLIIIIIVNNINYSLVGIATGYGLDGPGIESRWGRDFPHLSRPALGPTQPPVPVLSQG